MVRRDTQAAATRIALLGAVLAMAAALAGGGWYVVAVIGCRMVQQLQRADPALVRSLDLGGLVTFCGRLGL